MINLNVMMIGGKLGFGLFTEYDIKNGETLGIFQSRYPTPQEILDDGDYLIRFDDEDQRVMTDNFKFINHSTLENNVIIWDDASIVATRDIKAGEQILSHYGEHWLQQQKELGNEVI